MLQMLFYVSETQENLRSTRSVKLFKFKFAETRSKVMIIVFKST